MEPQNRAQKTKEETQRFAERLHDWEWDWAKNSNAAAIKAAEEAVKTVLLVNGGSCVAMLAFIGSLAARTLVEPSQIVAVARPLIWFAGGVGAAVAAAFAAYFTNLAITAASNGKEFAFEWPFLRPTKTSKLASVLAEVFRWIGILAVIASLSCFGRGVWLTTSAFESLATVPLGTGKP